MNRLSLILLMSILFISCKSEIEGTSGSISFKELKVDAFDKLEINCNCDVTIIPSTETKIEIETHQNLIDNIEINTKKDKLTINETKKVSKYKLNNLNIYVNNLQEIKLNNQSKLKIAGTLKSDKILIETNDQATIKQAYVDFKDLSLTTNDQSKIEMTGLAIDLNLNSHDQSSVDLEKLQAVDVKFTAKNNAIITINPIKSLSGKASGNSIVTYFGDPNKDIKETDRALIQKK